MKVEVPNDNERNHKSKKDDTSPQNSIHSIKKIIIDSITKINNGENDPSGTIKGLVFIMMFRI